MSTITLPDWLVTERESLPSAQHIKSMEETWQVTLHQIVPIPLGRYIVYTIYWRPLSRQES